MNTGKAAGTEVVQLYLTFPAEAQEPPRQLKAFVKTPLLQPGGSVENLALDIQQRDMSIWDVVSRSWKAVAGEFTVEVGSSSRDIRLHSAVQLLEHMPYEGLFKVFV